MSFIYSPLSTKLIPCLLSRKLMSQHVLHVLRLYMEAAMGHNVNIQNGIRCLRANEAEATEFVSTGPLKATIFISRK
jgi:hypothetical protein